MFNEKEKDILSSLNDLFQLTRYNIETGQSIQAIELLNNIHASYNIITKSSKFNEEKKTYFKEMYSSRMKVLTKEAEKSYDGQFLKRMSELTF